MSKLSKARRRFFGSPRSLSTANLSTTLSDELRLKHGRRSFRVRKGDAVKVLRGEYSGIEGKVTKVYPEEGRLAISGITREKIAGGTVPIKIHASKVMITSLNLDDQWRRLSLEVRKGRGGEVSKAEEPKALRKAPLNTKARL